MITSFSPLSYRGMYTKPMRMP
ncbi:hypothetical protein F383_31694 [Gossypium arboreum]|uniref:Uncharacterized protein n=1 Tax=Gossypium arboreum TaxID=29729 RepID=A0A0B0PGD3_GOSAR|nr:hypothetical protein F383_31694 [Gossypium arboreum]